MLNIKLNSSYKYKAIIEMVKDRIRR